MSRSARQYVYLTIKDLIMEFRDKYRASVVLWAAFYMDVWGVSPTAK